MLYPEAKEREERFKLALRMGLPIFSLSVILIFVGLSEYFNTIPASFFIMAIVILGVMIYFIFYLIYIGFDERITDPITHTFTREYLLPLFKKEIVKGPYTIVLISIDNLNDINQRYSTMNGDKVLLDFSHRIGRFFREKRIEKFPIGHYKGGDFLIGLRGEKKEYTTLFDLLCIKMDSQVFDDIEINVSGALVDTTLTTDVNQLITRLFELQLQGKADKEHHEEEEEFNPSELELSVIAAIKERRFSMQFQKVLEHGKRAMAESSVKLYNSGGKLIHQKSYIPVINRLGLSREFDTMLLEYLVDLCSKNSSPIIYAFTLFPSTVRNQNFFHNAQMLLSNNSAAKGHIMFVLSEQEYFSKIERFNDMLQSYRRMGILIALDRLGIFQTSLLYLKALSVDLVRFDVNYGKQIKEPGYQGILKGLNLSAQVLGVKTWVKMIEDAEAMRVAESIGVNFIQGNYIGKIAPLEEILEGKKQ
ncbi:MAG: EAL domain-containing protein [Campylobacterota bacterium]|nr:EAL domain-containing protein [Campylobacterota bacterium]